MAGITDPKTPNRGVSGPMGTLTSCVFILTVLASVAAVHWLQGLLTPLIVAIFLLILIDALSRQIARLLPSSPDWARVGASTILLIGLMFAAGLVVAHSAPHFAASLTGVTGKAQHVLIEITDHFGIPTYRAQALLDDLDLSPYIRGLVVTVREMATGTILVVVYLSFLLASRQAFEHKVRLLFADTEGLAHAGRVFTRIRNGAESYVGLQTLKAFLLGVLAWSIMRIVGLENALFLSFLVFLAAYVPLLGPAAAVIVPVALALLQFDLSWKPLILFLALETVVILVDNVLLPRLQSERMDLDPVVVLLSLGFWSAIFGMTGALLSTPLTVVVIAMASEAPRLRWLAIVLSKRGEPMNETEPAEPLSPPPSQAQVG